MKTHEFYCPHCDSVIELSQEAIGTTVSCPACNQPFLAKSLRPTQKTLDELAEEFNAENGIPIDITDSVTHEEFVAGVAEGKVGFKCQIGEPCNLLRGARKVIFNALVVAYMVGPLFLVPLWAYHAGNWWLLLGVLTSYAATFATGNKIPLVALFCLICGGTWLVRGFDLPSYATFHLLCVLWGGLIFSVAEEAQKTYATQMLVNDPAFFAHAIQKEWIAVIRKRETQEV